MKKVIYAIIIIVVLFTASAIVYNKLNKEPEPEQFCEWVQHPDGIHGTMVCVDNPDYDGE